MPSASWSGSSGDLARADARPVTLGDERRVERMVAQDSQKPSSLDLSAFDRYRTNVQALRRINGTIKHYLDIDVTLDRGEVQSLAEALQQTGRSLR